MREAVNNQQQKQSKQKTVLQSQVQTSHRASQGHHQKANSMSIKVGQNAQQHLLLYEEQQQQQVKKNQQPTMMAVNSSSAGVGGSSQLTHIQNIAQIQAQINQTPIGSINQPSIHHSQFYKQNDPQNSSNITHNQQPIQSISNQNSFMNHELVSYSQDYQKAYFHDEMGTVDGGAGHFFEKEVVELSNPVYMQQIPSTKVIGTMPQQTYQQDPMLQATAFQDQPTTTTTIKKQSTTVNSKNTYVKSSAQKIQKKGMNIHHARTKSDNIYNRGSIAANNTPAHAAKNIGTSQQTKRMSNVMKNNFVDNEYPATKAQKQNFVIMSGEALQHQQQRKVPQSAHHSKKPSITNQPVQIQQSAQKKTTKEKYIELKAMYNDLLEKHYALATQAQSSNLQYQIPQPQQTNKISQPAQNIINFFPPQQQFIVQNQVDGPKVLMTNQLSQSTLQAQPQQIFIQDMGSQEAKSIKSTTKKMDLQPQVEQYSKQAKASLKMQLAQGQSRKAGAHHKRSVSDGNEQLFKFKQAAMQRYLYPQPSNQALQTAQVSAPTQQTEDTIPSARGNQVFIQPVSYQQPTHQRRVSDDYNQKKNKQQVIVQKQQQAISQTIENVPQDAPENHKPQVDFNIKGFLIEMRNKHEKSQVSDQQLVQKQPKPTQKQFAMIIEENSPTNNDLVQQQSIGTINSSRKLSIADAQAQNKPIAGKPNVEFNKLLQKYKKLRIDEHKRASSPSVCDRQTESLVHDKNKKLEAHHKRVKSDIPENPKKKQLHINSSIAQNQKSAMNKKGSQQSSSSNIAHQQVEKMTPRKPNNTNQKYMGGSNPIFDGGNSKKVINVSIDLIRDAEVDPSIIGEEANFEGGQWIEIDEHLNPMDVIRDKKNQIQNLQTQNQVQQKAVAAQGQSGNSDGGRQDKYKKMIQKYSGHDQKLFNIPEKIANKVDSYTNSPVNKKSDKYSFGENRILPNPPQSPYNQKSERQQNKVAVQKPQSQATEQNQKKTNAPANSFIQTQESMNTLAQQQNNQAEERIETLESTQSDPNLSPRQKAITKLIKHIKLHFRQNGQAPNTTVDFYRIGKVLGKGAFGKVNLALHKLTQKYAAVKSINKQYLSEEAQTKKVMQEVVILKKTRHRNIVRLYEFFETQKHLLFVMELCAGGDLLNYVRKRRRLKEDVAKYIFKQIIEGLGYCHSKQILHRDIKLDNILLDSEGEVKICDFGVSKIVKKGEKMTEQCGTPAYIAPEILRDKGYEGFAVDIWSSGVVLYAMLYGTVPFKANNMSELQKLIIKAKYTLKDDVSDSARNLLYSLLEKDPAKRLSIPQVLAHEWLQDLDEHIQLFTEQEKEYIKNEFTYNDAERYNRNETDPFTDHLLDSTQNSILKNASTKSVILAPFNSTRSDLDNYVTLSDSVKELMQSKRCLKFAGRVRDIDKQYEINNNAELDNGVYHKFDEEENKEEEKKKDLDSSDDSLRTSFNRETIRSDDDEEERRLREKRKADKKRKKEQTELEKLESMIQQEEQKPEDLDYPYGNLSDSERKPHHINDSDIKRSPRPVTEALHSAQTLIMDEKLVQQIETYGYPRDYIIKCLNNNELNYATTSYYLMTNQHGIQY